MRSDIQHVEFQRNMEIPCKQLEMRNKKAGEKAEPEQDLYYKIHIKSKVLIMVKPCLPSICLSHRCTL